MNSKRFAAFAFAILAVIFFANQPAWSQTTVSTGSIQGTVTDPQGATVPEAKITVTNKGTGQATPVPLSSAGTYNSGQLNPGTYIVRVEAPGFKTVQTTVEVQVGGVTANNVTLAVGSATTIVEVTAEETHVNTEQATVQSVLTGDQIDNLPVNGRNFLDLAQLQPGVQIQDGSTFDPTKNGYSSVSFAGRYGRAARIEIDGVDISDENVGTTTQNIPQSAISEFQVEGSSLDMSTEISGTGAINVATRSGTNQLHGEGFFGGRSDQLAARFATAALPFARKQYGVRLGGPFIKDKLFFFGDWERTQQDQAAPVTLGAPFSALTGSFNSPFRDNEYLGRLDYVVKNNWRVFARFNYENNLSGRGFVPNVYQPFSNIDHTRVYAVGTDFNTGTFSHSIRFGYTKFHNQIADGTSGLSGGSNPVPGLAINIGNDLICLSGVDNYCSGPNFLAPQVTYQSDKQIKYDGSKIIRSHILRYGAEFNKLLGGGFASFVGTGPIANATLTQVAVPNDPNPLHYFADLVLLGNGFGFASEIPQFNLPAGGLFDSRFEAYFGDSWKMWRRFTLTYGVRYDRDTGRSDADLAGIPQYAAFDNQFISGLEKPVRQPNNGFAPNLAFAWDPKGDGKTVIRAGGGLYYDNSVWNNVLFDRSVRLQNGFFLSNPAACAGGAPLPVFVGKTKLPPATFCGQPIGTVGSQIIAYEKAYQAAVKAAGPQSNINFIGTSLAAGAATGTSPLFPGYKAPRTWQMNVGIARELRPGTVLSVDYVRAVGLHSLLQYDTNHIGDARFLNMPAAVAAINKTLTACGAGTINQAIAACPGLHPTGGATIGDFAGNGLDSSLALASGFPCAPPGCAFAGVNPAVGMNQMFFPIGRSVYSGMQVGLKSDVKRPMAGVRNLNLQVGYALSRYKATALDTDFITGATDFANPNKFFGPNGLDRTHQLGVGAIMDLPLGLRFSTVTHWATALPQTLTLPSGSIFTNDIIGDGSFGGNTNGKPGDPLPGTNLGSFGRSIKVGDLNNVINNFNTNFAGKLTPAGQALVSAGLFTQAQLTALGAVIPAIKDAPAGEVGLSPAYTTDVHLSVRLRPNRIWHRLPEQFVIAPEAALYNVFNFQNWDAAGAVTRGILDGSQGSLNGTTAHGATPRTNLVSLGSGTYGYGAPRQAEFGAKISF
ncbi:MAG: carboxypeptidase regulatory-like domain-containing protein [Candidatus Acidiferrales bacterium]